MVFLWLALISGILSCPVFVYDDSIPDPDTCMTGSNNTYSVKLCPDSFYCLTDFLHGTCKETPYAATVFPGSFCDDEKYFCIGSCEDNVCKGKPKDSNCKFLHDCDIGLTCLSRKCTKQLQKGEECFDDWECENNTFCHDGKCTLYYSLEAGQVSNRFNSFFHDEGCKSGINNKGVCIEFPKSIELVENNCEDPLERGWCLFKTNNGESFSTECQCQFASYDCGAIFDQEYQQEYIKLRKQWFGGDLIKNCHTSSRAITECMRFQDPELYGKLKTYERLARAHLKIDGIDPKLVEAMIKSTYFLSW